MAGRGAASSSSTPNDGAKLVTASARRCVAGALRGRSRGGGRSGALLGRCEERRAKRGGTYSRRSSAPTLLSPSPPSRLLGSGVAAPCARRAPAPLPLRLVPLRASRGGVASLADQLRTDASDGSSTNRGRAGARDAASVDSASSESSAALAAAAAAAPLRGADLERGGAVRGRDGVRGCTGDGGGRRRGVVAAAACGDPPRELRLAIVRAPPPAARCSLSRSP
mmetsp:Transcript_36405/g.107466  ORF Transcript_36405/g.107466 Transcript_36405/m.107466 type:complete len:224 (-) Transcript_36405:172-843(-)|eukprot:363939-Chlamydomonas_euryale.AAC.1